MDSDLKEYLYDKYNISILTYEKITAGFVNDIYHIKTNSEDYILKKYNLLNDFQIDLSISVQRYMSNKNLSPQIFIDGFFEGKFILQEYIPSDEKSNITWKKFGENLAIIHNYLKKYNKKSVKKFIQTNYFEVDLKELSIDQQYLIKLKKEMTLIFNKVSLNKTQLIHGDYTYNNLIYNNSKLYTIDFDQVKNYYTIYDISKVILNIIFFQPKSDKIWININEFIRGYENFNEISNDEKKEFLNIYGYTLLCDMSGLCNTNNKDANYLKKRIDIHKNLIQCYQEKNELFRRIKW